MRHLLWIAVGAAMLVAPPAPAAAAPREKAAAAAPQKSKAQPNRGKRAPARKQAAPVAAVEKAAEAAKPAPPAEGQPLRRGERVEFDARLIQGQTAKAGAVYLFERASSDLSSMVDQRKSYRTEIVEEVFPEEDDL
jgi:hypothetical protein